MIDLKAAFGADFDIIVVEDHPLVTLVNILLTTILRDSFHQEEISC